MIDNQGGLARPPGVAERLLEVLLPPEERFTVTGDLNEEYSTCVRPERGKWRADVWYWRQALASIGPTLIKRSRQRKRKRQTQRTIGLAFCPPEIDIEKVHRLYRIMPFAGGFLLVTRTYSPVPSVVAFIEFGKPLEVSN